MPARDIPDRIVWAVEALNVGPSEHMLEIGCGHGLAVPLVCEKLLHGTLTAIDQSPKMTAVAEKRNRILVAAGKVAFETVALAGADFGRRRFSKIFAINVNLFWTDPAAELPVVSKLLRPDGALYLFYQPPNPAQLKPLAAKLVRNLQGLVVARTVFGPNGLLCLIARAGKESA